MTSSSSSSAYDCRPLPPTTTTTRVVAYGFVWLAFVVQSSFSFSWSLSSSPQSSFQPRVVSLFLKQQQHTVLSATVSTSGTPQPNKNDNNDDDDDAPVSSSSSSSLPKRSLVIWDCDGVLVDSEALLKQGEVEGLAKAGITVTVDDCVRMFSGVSPDQAITNFKQHTGLDIPPTFFPEQIAGSLELFRQRLQPLMLHTVSRLQEDLGAGQQQCIASGSPKERVELCVDVAHMRPYFPTHRVYTRELVSEGKPAPDLFWYAAADMGYTPDECLVIEDSSSGIRAAQAAGMEVLGFLGGGHTNADWYVQEIMDFGIPVVHTEEEVYEYIRNRIVEPVPSSSSVSSVSVSAQEQQPQ